MIHVIISTERRLAPRAEIAQERRHIGKGKAYKVVNRLHVVGSVLNNPNDPVILYCMQWDGISPWGTLLKGAAIETQDTYYGWPKIDKATWQAANPV